MSEIRQHLCLLAVSIVGVGGSTTALAQTADAGDQGSADIVVTARRVEERLQDVPISLTVFNQNQLTNRNITNSAQLATYTPSLSVNSRYGPEKSSFSIRGFVEETFTAPSVGVYFADVIAPRTGSTTSGGNGVGVGSMFDLQSVQVLKGPQGTLFGRNTTGGAVLLVPRKPTDRLEGYIEGSYGNYDMRRVQAMLNLPLSDTFRVRLGVDRTKRDGYLTNHSGLGPDHFADLDYTAARLSIVGDLTPDLENYTIAAWSNSHNNGVVQRIVGYDPTSPVGGFYGKAQFDRQKARGDGPYDVENDYPNPTLRLQQWQVINTTTWKVSDSVTLKNILSYGEHRETIRVSLVGENLVNPLIPNNTKPDFGFVLLGNNTGYHNGSESTFTEELRLQGKTPNGKLTWQAGGYYESNDPIGVESQLTPIFVNCTDAYALKCSGAAYVTIPFFKTWWQSKGLYAQGTYKFTPQLSMTGGIRYTWDYTRSDYANVAAYFPTPNNPFFVCNNTAYFGGVPFPIANQFDYGPCNKSFSARSHKPTWTIDLEYKPIDDLMLYGKWSRGYRAGGAGSSNQFYETWGPESVDTFEVGSKFAFSGPVHGYFNITGFYNDFRNQQIQANLTGKPPFIGGSAIINAGKSRIWGFEVDSSISPFHGLQIDLGYSYLNTKILSFNIPPQPPELANIYFPPAPTAVLGGPLGLSPKNRLSLTGTYTLPLDDSIGKISVSATYTHTDKQIASTATLPEFGNLPASDLLNLNVNWNDAFSLPIDLSFFMTNVTKEVFPVNVGNAYRSIGIETQLFNEPRMYGVRVKYRFGQ